MSPLILFSKSGKRIVKVKNVLSPYICQNIYRTDQPEKYLMGDYGIKYTFLHNYIEIKNVRKKKR